MRKFFILLFCAIVSLLFITACENERENHEISLGEKFINDLYNVDEPIVDINDSSVEELIEFQNRFSSYFTKEEFKNLANRRFFLLPQEISNKQNSKIVVKDISFIKNNNNQGEEKTVDFDFNFTLLFTDTNENKLDEIEVRGQMSIIKSKSELKISRYHDNEPLKDMFYKDSSTN